MDITTFISRFLARLSTFGPVSAGAAIPAGATAVDESQDDVDPDMGDGAGAGAGDANPDEGKGSAEGSASADDDDAQGSGADDSDEPNEGDEGDADETSTEPSSDGDTAAGAKEADKGVDPNVVEAVRAAVDVLVSQPDGEAPTTMRVNFTPEITQEQFAEYEAAVEAGKGPQALSKLLGSAVSQALNLYDEKRVLPMETSLSEAKRNAANDRRIADWTKKNAATLEADPTLWPRMVEVYKGYAAKAGRGADRITIEQLAILAGGKVAGAAKPEAAGGTGVDAKAAKKKAIGATRTPGSIATLSRGGAKPEKDKGYDGPSYRQHLKADNRDPF